MCRGTPARGTFKFISSPWEYVQHISGRSPHDDLHTLAYVRIWCRGCLIHRSWHRLWDVDLLQAVFAAKPQRLLAEWQNGFCQTQNSWQNPLNIWQKFFRRWIWTPWVKARLQPSRKSPQQRLAKVWLNGTNCSKPLKHKKKKKKR